MLITRHKKLRATVVPSLSIYGVRQIHQQRGCIALRNKHLLMMLHWLDKAQYPYIILSIKSYKIRIKRKRIKMHLLFLIILKIIEICPQRFSFNFTLSSSLTELPLNSVRLNL